MIEEYQEQGYSLTLRQVYYQMVARDIIPNNERSYKNDALEPQVISDLIEKNVLQYRKNKAYQIVKKQEEQEKDKLYEVAKNWR